MHVVLLFFKTYSPLNRHGACNFKEQNSAVFHWSWGEVYWCFKFDVCVFIFAGKGILMVLIKWILPIWTFSLLVALGAIKLPFMDDLIL